MDFIEPIPVFIAGIFSDAMINGFMAIAPFFKAVIDIFIGINLGIRTNGTFDNGFNRLLFDIFQHCDKDFSSALDHPKDRRLFLLQCAPTTRTLQPTTTACTALFFTASG